MLDKFFQHHKNRRVAVALALLGTVTPIAGLHKLYLGQPVWGIIYILLWTTPISRIAAAIDADHSLSTGIAKYLGENQFLL